MKKQFKIPHVYIILLSVMLVIILISYVIPSGEYKRVTDPKTGQISVDPNSFEYIDKPKKENPISFFAAIYKGSMKASGIIFSLLLVVGALELLDYSGTVKKGINKLVKITKGKEYLVPPLLVVVFTVLGSIGFQEGALPFYPMAVSIALAIGYDRIVGVSSAIFGLISGYTGGALNMFTTGLSHRIIGLPLYSGVLFRYSFTALFATISIIYLVRYMKKIKNDPNKSYVKDEYISQTKVTHSEDSTFTFKEASTLIGLLIVIFFQGYGSIKLGWGLGEISAAYLLLAVYIAIIFKISPSNASLIFAQGASKMLPASLTIGLANAVMVLMDNAKIVDTVIYNLVQTFEGKSTITIALIIYLAVILFNAFVTTGSGKAMILIPILSPFAQILKIKQQIMVLIYQYGDGFTNYIYPTSGFLMAGLQMCKLEWGTWAKYFWKLVVIFQIVAFLIIMFAFQIGLS